MFLYTLFSWKFIKRLCILNLIDFLNCLRATTKEESLSLPGSRVKLTLSPLRRGEDEPSSSREETTSSRKDEPQEDEDQIQIRGGINVLKSIKKRKSERLKNLNPTPSTKSLLRYKKLILICVQFLVACNAPFKLLL